MSNLDIFTKVELQAAFFQVMFLGKDPEISF